MAMTKLPLSSGNRSNTNELKFHDVQDSQCVYQIIIKEHDDNFRAHSKFLTLTCTYVGTLSKGTTTHHLSTSAPL